MPNDTMILANTLFTGAARQVMGGSTAKKVVVKRFDRETVAGFVDPRNYLQPQFLEVLRPSGDLVVLPYSQVKYVSFVKDFDGEPLTRTVFHSRPKFEGLWLRMSLLDGDIMEGVIPNNLLVWEQAGFTFTPPEPDGNNQRLFVPRLAVRTIQVLGVVGSPLHNAAAAGRKKKSQAGPEQPRLF